jgi:hypothetical protein
MHCDTSNDDVRSLSTPYTLIDDTQTKDASSCADKLDSPATYPSTSGVNKLEPVFTTHTFVRQSLPSTKAICGIDTIGTCNVHVRVVRV